jgi:hypothetical protein
MRSLPVVIFSDSEPKEVAKVIDNEIITTSANIFNLDTISTITECLNYKIFIGTNSKISSWIVLFRYFLQEDAISYLPAPLAKAVQAHVGDLDSRLKIRAYND